MIKNVYKIRGGSALLVAMLVMGVLLTLTLGLSTLVIREIRQTADLVAAGKAYYAAEAGVENALYDLSENLPGFEVDVDYPGDGDDDDEFLNYHYIIDNKGDKYPYFPADEPIFLPSGLAVTSAELYGDNSPDPGMTYNVLSLNQSVTIPLFISGDDGKVKDIEDFLIQYYVEFKPSPNLNIKLQDFDILRWKVFGNPCDTPDCNNPDYLKTDAISDFYPANDGVSASNPVCIGTIDYLHSYLNGGGKCMAPVVGEISKGVDEIKIEDIAQSGFSYARECFLSEVSDFTIGSMKSENVLTRCSIESFIKGHTRNYVTLTNMVNMDILGFDPQFNPEVGNIYYRLVAPSAGDSDSGPLVREFADISSDGYANDKSVKQSIDVKLRLSSFLPVFNFSLYRTDTTLSRSNILK